MLRKPNGGGASGQYQGQVGGGTLNPPSPYKYGQRSGILLCPLGYQMPTAFFCPSVCLSLYDLTNPILLLNKDQ